MIKDRTDCPSCGKEVLSPNREVISTCPHCGGWIPLVKWEEKEDLTNFMNSVKAAMGQPDQSSKTKGKGRFSLRSLFKKSD